MSRKRTFGGSGLLSWHSIKECLVIAPRSCHYVDDDGRRRCTTLARWLYAKRIGRLLPADYVLVHSVDCEPGCVNPWHATAEHRSVRRQVRCYKLSDDQVRAIRADPRPAPAVAVELGVSVGHIHQIRQGRRKAGVPELPPARPSQDQSAAPDSQTLDIPAAAE